MSLSATGLKAILQIDLEKMKSGDVLRLLQLKTVFGKPRHSSVVFCTDASEKRNKIKTVIRQHVVAHLYQMRKKGLCKFNIVFFSVEN